jgi:hypothetical protein
MTTRCHNPKCQRSFDRPKGSKLGFCSDQCRQDVNHARRRIRDALKAEKTRLDQSAQWWCEDCQAELTGDELAEHDECYLTLLSVDRRCRSCGKPISTDTPNDPYCDQSCFLAFWSGIFPDDIGDVTHHVDYAVLNGLTGVLPQTDAADLFGTTDKPLTGYQSVDLRKLHDEDRATAQDLAHLDVS